MELSHFMALNHLARASSERTPAQLADRFHVTRGAMTNTLSRLEAAGHVHIRPDWDDARRKLVSISPAGRAARDAALRLCSLLQAEDSRVALRAAIAILDRTGHGPAQRIDLTATERYPVAERADAAEELARLLSGMDAAAK